MTARSVLYCGGCSAGVDLAEPYPWRCPRAGDGGDHVLRRWLDPASVSFPIGGEPGDGHPNPYIRFRHLMRPFHVAANGGMTEAEYVDLVRALDQAVAAVEGHRIVRTPLVSAATLATAIELPGALLVKNETKGIAGSHKGRHLFGILLHLEIARRLGLDHGDQGARELAIASCGNAALAAGVLASAAGRPLRVFVPTDADPGVVSRLRALSATVEPCPREEGAHGDPAYLRLQAALERGAIPFTCQGNENGLAVESGATLAYELAADLATAKLVCDHIVVQVGGGALASAVALGFADAVELGALPRGPRIHTVQTAGAWPLARAFQRVIGLLPQSGFGWEELRSAMRYAAANRSQFMWPWDVTPRSVAHGILDDETYDWLAVVEAMLLSGGRAVVVTDEELLAANKIAVAHTTIEVDETGSAGLAGLIKLRQEGVIGEGETVVVLFTGARRR